MHEDEKVDLELDGMLREYRDRRKNWFKGPYKVIVFISITILIITQNVLLPAEMQLTLWLEVLVTLSCFIIPLPFVYLTTPKPQRKDAQHRVESGQAKHLPKAFFID